MTFLITALEFHCIFANPRDFGMFVRNIFLKNKLIVDWLSSRIQYFVLFVLFDLIQTPPTPQSHPYMWTNKWLSHVSCCINLCSIYFILLVICIYNDPYNYSYNI